MGGYIGAKSAVALYDSYTKEQTDAITGSNRRIVTITPADNADIVLTPEQYTADILVIETGAWTEARNIIVPNSSHSWLVFSNSAHAATVKTAAGTGVAVPAGQSRPLVCNETNVVDPSSVFRTVDIFGQRLLHIQDQRASGVNGGGFTSGSFVTRVLNTVVTNDISGSSLATNQVTLSAGKYALDAAATAYNVGQNVAKIRDITNSTDLLIGYPGFSNTSHPSTVWAGVSGVFQLLTTTTIELQHRCQATKETNGAGVATGFGVVEVYADLKIWRIE